MSTTVLKTLGTMPRRPLILSLLLLLPLSAAAQDVDQSQAVKQLEEKGLVRQGTAWINRTEERVRNLLADIPAARHQFYVAEYERWELMQVRFTQARGEELKKNERDVVLFRELSTELSLAEERADRFSKLARVSQRSKPKILPDAELHRKVQASIKARNALAVMLLELDRLTDEAIIQSYMPFLEDGDVGVALRTFGPQARLGPLKRYDAARRELKRVRDDVFTDAVPMIPIDERYVFWGLANDRLPVELMYRPENSLTLLPEELVRQLDVELNPEKTPRITVSIGDRQQDVYLIRLPRLRIGRHVLNDIEAAVLPGAKRGQLGHDALGRFRPVLHTRRLEFELNSGFEVDAIRFQQPDLPGR